MSGFKISTESLRPEFYQVADLQKFSVEQAFLLEQ